MEEKLIEPKTALLAKEKGFIEHRGHLKMYRDEDGHLFSNIGPAYDILNHCSHAPTQSLLQKWLRDIYNVHIYIKKGYFESDKGLFWYLNVMKIGTDTSDDGQVSSSIQELEGTFEEVLEVGLLEALKIIK